MEPPKNGQKRPFLAQNSHLEHFCRLKPGHIWTTLLVQNASEGVFLLSTNSIRSKISKTLLKSQKHQKMAIFSPKMAIFGHFEGGVPWAFVACNWSISKKHPFAPQYPKFSTLTWKIKKWWTKSLRDPFCKRLLYFTFYVLKHVFYNKRKIF